MLVTQGDSPSQILLQLCRFFHHEILKVIQGITEQSLFWAGNAKCRQTHGQVGTLQHRLRSSGVQHESQNVLVTLCKNL